jgi:hypothetical protein
VSIQYLADFCLSHLLQSHSDVFFRAMELGKAPRQRGASSTSAVRVDDRGQACGTRRAASQRYAGDIQRCLGDPEPGRARTRQPAPRKGASGTRVDLWREKR